MQILVTTTWIGRGGRSSSGEKLPLKRRREKITHMDMEHGIPSYDDIDGGDDDYSEMEDEDIIEISH